MTTITVGGRVAQPVEAPPAGSAFPAWEREVSELLTASVALKPARERLAKMTDWLAANPWDELAMEREAKRDALASEVFAAECALADRSERIARLQERLTDAERGGLIALLGRIGPVDARVWAKVARASGSTDLFEVANASVGLLEGWATETGEIVSWVKVWQLAQERGYATRAELEAAVGPLGHDPQDVRERLGIARSERTVETRPLVELVQP